MNAAGLVVDVEHAAADHDRHENGQRDRARQKKFHVFDVGIKLHNLQHGFLQKARLDHGIVQRVGNLGERVLERRAHEIVAVIHHQRDLRPVLLVNPAGILRRNNDGALDLSVAHVFHRLLLVGVIDGQEGAHVGADRIERPRES